MIDEVAKGDTNLLKNLLEVCPQVAPCRPSVESVVFCKELNLARNSITCEMHNSIDLLDLKYEI